MPQDIFTQLRDANPQVWDAYTRHQFVEQLGAGTLHKSSFQHYLIQDYQFLKQFIRALALGVYKAETLEDMRFFQSMIEAILNTEMALHVAYSKEWGIDAQTLENNPEAFATIAYTRYVLDVAMTGDVLDLMVALSPCMLGYAEIATRLLPLSPVDNPYQPWIFTYSGQEYLNVATTTKEYLNTLCLRAGTPQRLAKLHTIFSTATQLEAAFWQQSIEHHLQKTSEVFASESRLNGVGLTPMTERGDKKRTLFDPQANEALVSASPQGAAESLGKLDDVAQLNYGRLMGVV